MHHTITNKPVWIILFSFLASNMPLTAQETTKPNIILILTDDMGYGDISSYGGPYGTPHIDKMAEEGIRFTNYYSAAPICSPSRVGLLTGMAPGRWNFTTFLNNKEANRHAEQKDFLDPGAPTVAKFLKTAGYTTAHFGKWHMGGGRDVTEAPNFDQYGFDEWASTYESPDPDPLLTATDWIWSDQDSIKRWDRTAYFVDRTLRFLEENKGKPCYINLWPDDVHTPWVPEGAEGLREGFQGEPNFAAVLAEYDRQIGRLMEGLKRLGIDDNTLVIFTSDNGPMPNFRQDRSKQLRGSKLSLYEGGIRLPFIVRWPGKINRAVDSTSVIAANDLLPSFCRMAGARPDRHYRSDGEDRSDALLGKASRRRKAIYWEYGRNDTAFNYPKGKNRSPALAMREKNWKFLMNADGSGVELYDLATDQTESHNVAAENEALVRRFTASMLDWWKGLPAYQVN
ncbi:sulfatase-like hydrolase/transferase [Parapedobacter sp. DT-150]|uniref:sulfatase-like hydrolase/transferase n=1 Tax=Parapedobacter sp. DT-150 TaxID=3396162 RepID=UPI003F1C45F5